MSEQQPKSTNELMIYLRKNKGIRIYGSSDKRKLMNIGYYHGYKGYRYVSNPANKIPYTEFGELVSIYDFDTQLKSLLYPCVMQIETAFKNYVLEVLVTSTKSSNFIDIYNKLLDNYKMFSIKGKKMDSSDSYKEIEKKYKLELKKRLDLRNRIYKVQTDAYGNGNKIANHYLQNDANLPIWAIFELLSFGEFGHFVSCLNKTCRIEISQKFGIRPPDDTNAMLPQRLIYATKDLRNAIAHNDVIFDTRFRTNNIHKQISNVIHNVTGINDIKFNTITDYIILIIFELKLLKLTKTEMKQVVSNYESIVENLRRNVPAHIFNQIVHTDSKDKLDQLKKFISS